MWGIWLANSYQISDDLGRELRFERVPQRIVSLVPSLTEYLFWLGLAEQIVGITDYCIVPAAQVATVPKVRGTKNPNREQIIALAPDLIIANKEENRQRDIAALEAAGLPIYVSDIDSVQQAMASLQNIAGMLGCSAQAEPLIQAIQAELGIKPSKQQRVATTIWRDPWMWVGKATYAADLLACCGANNCLADPAGRYPRLELAELSALQPDRILLPDEPYAFSQADADELQGLAPRIDCCDGQLLTWYGPRIPLALQTYRRLLHAD